MQRDAVWQSSKAIAPIYNFDPVLMLALFEQESVDPHDPTIYRERAAALEEGYYLNYTEPLILCTTNEVLLAASYGLPQMMGLSLKEVGYFDWWFNQQPPITQQFLGDPMSEIAVPKAINEFQMHPEWQVERGCQYMTKKRAIAHGDDMMMLRYWNGDVKGLKRYGESVLARAINLRKIYAPGTT